MRCSRIWPIHRPSKYIPSLLLIFRESNGKYIFWCVLNLLNFMALRNGNKYKIRNSKVLKTNIWGLYHNILQKMGRRNSSKMILYLQATWKMPKRTLSWQSEFNKFSQTCLLARCNAPRCFAKKESVIILKMTNFWRKNLAIFHDVKKKRFIFFITHLFLIFVNKEIFFQEYILMELKIFFIIFERFFKWQKKDIAKVTFKQACITCR